MTRQLHLGGFLIASPVTHSHAAWRHPGSETDYFGPDHYHRVGRILESWGFDVAVCPVDEFLKAGGGCRCLTLALDVTFGR